MKKITYIFSILILLIIPYSKANHYRGYDMSIVSLGSDMYKIRLITYSDIGGIQADSFFQFNVFKNADNSAAPIPLISVYRKNSTVVTQDPNGCPLPYNKTYLKSNYESNALNLSSFNSSSGYYVSKSIMGRDYSIINIINSSNAGILFTMDFPSLDSNSITRYNSSPEFKKEPFSFFKSGKSYSFNFNVIDPDGDSLVYYIENPFAGGTTKPFQNATFSKGYKLDSNIADGAPDFLINKITGDVLYKSIKAQGNYIVSIKVEEWKRANGSVNAYKIGEIKREFQFETPNWQDLLPNISDDKNRTKNIVDTISFTNGGIVDYARKFKSDIFCGFQDSVSFRIFPNSKPYNIFNNNLNATLNGSNQYVDSNLIFKDECSIRLDFKWKIDSTMGNKTPVKFTIVSYDNNCPKRRMDTMNVSIYIPHLQCYKTLNQIIQLKGCDSVKGLNGIWYKKNGLYVDTVLSRSGFGCDTVWVHNVTLGVARVTYNLSGCDSVIGLDKKIYRTTGNYVFTISKANCDSIITQVIKVYKSVIKKAIKGEQNPAPNALLQYSFTISPKDSLYWSVENGNIIVQDNYNAVIRWNNSGLGKIIVNEITQQGCITQNEMIIYIGGTAINNIKNSNIKIYPNPTSDIINIEGLTKNENNTIQIFDVQGKLVITKTITEKGAIDLSELNKGIYVIKIGEVAQRIVKM